MNPPRSNSSTTPNKEIRSLASSKRSAKLDTSVRSTRTVSRDEMNLAEFPLTVLSTRSDPLIKTLEFSDVVKGKNGDSVNRHWIITGADKFGLPTSSDDEVLLGLLKLTVEDGMRNRKVNFTRYELLKVLRWTTEGRSYLRLQKALDRLSGVRIKATNAFFENDSKLHVTKNFGLIDSYEINSSREGDARTSFFQWSDVLFKSFQVGFIKKLDLDFYLDLKTAVSKRLYRYLDKHFWYKSTVTLNAFTLCHEKIGVSRNYRYASSLRQQLDPALTELVTKGFISEFNYVGRGKDTIVEMTAGRAIKPMPIANGSETSLLQGPKKPDDVNRFKERLGNSQQQAADLTLKGAGNSVNGNLNSMVAAELVGRGLTEGQAVRLVADRTEDTLARMSEIVKYYDSLCQKGNKLVLRSPIGFLYRAVENPHSFKIPKFDGHKSESTTKHPAKFVLNKQVAQGELPLLAKKLPVKADRSLPIEGELEAAFLTERMKKLQEAKSTLPQVKKNELYQEVERALSKLKHLITPPRFREAIEHAVDEKIVRLAGIADFDEWLGNRK